MYLFPQIISNQRFSFSKTKIVKQFTKVIFYVKTCFFVWGYFELNFIKSTTRNLREKAAALGQVKVEKNALQTSCIQSLYCPETQVPNATVSFSAFQLNYKTKIGKKKKDGFVHSCTNMAWGGNKKVQFSFSFCLGLSDTYRKPWHRG